MLVTLREDPAPFLEVLLHSHLASRVCACTCACACEWLRLSCSLPGFHCVLVKDTSDQTRLLRYKVMLASDIYLKETAFKGLNKDANKCGINQPLSPLSGVTGPETSLYSKDHGHRG